MNLIEKLIRWAYAPEEAKLDGVYDLVVPIDYGCVTDRGTGVIPVIARNCLLKAARILSAGTARQVGWANSLYFGETMEMIDAEKCEFVGRNGVRSTVCTNTIDEAENLITEFPEARRILIICDWRHAARVQFIWNKLCTKEVTIVALDNRCWENAHRSVFLKWSWLFLVMNMAHHILLLTIGIDRLRKLRHPVSR